MITIESARSMTLIEDLGRPGHAHLGVSPSGAADRSSLMLANRLVRNPVGAAAFEILLGGLAFRTEAAVEVVLCGTDSELRVGGRSAGPNTPVVVAAGETAEVLPPSRGLRTYMAVRGGLAVESVLGSRSRDVLSGLGPDQVVAGDRIGVAETAAVGVAVDHAPVDPVAGRVDVGLMAGPHREWFEPDYLAVVAHSEYTVAVDSDRVGVRLDGRAVPRSTDAELPSEAMVRGAVQVPPDGAPIVLLADFPVTGGYPVAGVVVGPDLDRLAQARPGTAVRFHLIDQP